MTARHSTLDVPRPSAAAALRIARISAPTPSTRASAAWQRTLRLAALGLLGMLGATALALGLIYATLPGVSDAPALTAAIDARSHSTPIRVSPSSKIARALIAVEDERFQDHGAIDPVAIGRALLSTVTAGSVDPGGSTLTQQLAKVLYIDDHDTSLLGRLDAIELAFKLEQRYSKSQILDMYLNAVYFGHGFYGIRAASRGYFGPPPRATDMVTGRAAGRPSPGTISV